ARGNRNAIAPDRCATRHDEGANDGESARGDAVRGGDGAHGDDAHGGGGRGGDAEEAPTNRGEANGADVHGGLPPGLSRLAGAVSVSVRCRPQTRKPIQLIGGSATVAAAAILNARSRSFM